MTKHYSFASFQKQSKESLQQAAGARAESDAKLLSQVTEQLKTLVHESANQKQIAELEEAKIRLEERIRGNVALFTEIRNGKAAAEKREDDLKASHGKIVDELARLRETALASKKSAGTSIDHQTLLMKWTNTNNLLAESLQNIECKDQKLQAQEEQIQSLSAQLSQERDEQEKSAEEIQRLSERLPERSDQVIRAKEQLVRPFIRVVESLS